MRLEDLNIKILYDFVNINLLKISCLKKEVDFIYDNLIQIAEYNNEDKKNKIKYLGKILNKYLFKNNCYTDDTYIEFFSNNIDKNVYSILLNNDRNIFSNNIFNTLLTSPYLSNDKKTTLYNSLMKNISLKTYNHSKFTIKPPMFLKVENETFRDLNFSLFQNNINFYFYDKNGFNEYNETEIDRIQNIYVSSLTNGNNIDYLNMLFNSICYNKDIEVLNEIVYYVIVFLKNLERESNNILIEQDEFVKSTLRNISSNNYNKYYNYYDEDDLYDKRKKKNYFEDSNGYVFQEEYFEDSEDFKTQEDKDYEYQFNTYIRDKQDVIEGFTVGLLHFIKLVLSNDFTSINLIDENKANILKLLKPDIVYDVRIEKIVEISDYYLHQPLNDIGEIKELKIKNSKNKNIIINNLLSSSMITENKLIKEIIMKSDLKHIDFDYMISTGVTTNIVVNEYQKNKKEILSNHNLENFYKSLILHKEKFKENNNIFNVLKDTYNINNNESIICLEMVLSNDFSNKTEEEMNLFYKKINELLEECNIFKNKNKNKIKTKELKIDVSLLSSIYNNMFFMYEIIKRNYRLYNDIYELLLDLSFNSTITRNQNGERDYIIKFETLTNNFTSNNKNTNLFNEDNIEFFKEYISNRINITFVNEIYFNSEINYYSEVFNELISYSVIEKEITGILEIIYNEMNFEDIYNYNKKSFEDISNINKKSIEDFLTLSKNNYFRETSNLFLSINNYDRIIKRTNIINKISKNQLKLNF